MRKVDLCLSSEGSEVILATSSDEKHPPENIIDGKDHFMGYTFLHHSICSLRNQARVVTHGCDLIHTEGQLQNEEIVARDGYATYLRFIIISAFDHFASVHSISADGTVVSDFV
ncbi:PREDICTED: intraflagellar transport protein 25 homolog [Propithecus coquereli]|uniref:intraflagellar transport protein 25 homolog n=1 Tax=Propithecus coquereli TaxID=379532 RepID=UPI00063EE70C|nr:PREDICTED: intraflagellar transport protein 25 homolog [Propithecus coquereli]